MSVSQTATPPTIVTRPGAANAWLVGLVTAIIISVAIGIAWLTQPPTVTPLSADEIAPVSNTQQNSDVAATAKLTSPSHFSVVINRPQGPPRVATGMLDAHGAPVTVACSTCHATRRPNFDNKNAEDFDEFHRSMNVYHGALSCLSCHNENDYDSLKLADGTRVEYADVMTLCAQCHGPQMRDFEHGAHGGMNGYWDLSRGPQTKNNCIDCHPPHAPKFPKMTPNFKPQDRFLEH